MSVVTLAVLSMVTLVATTTRLLLFSFVFAAVLGNVGPYGYSEDPEAFH